MQLRIENQRKLDNHMRQVGLQVSETLIKQFDSQVNELNNDMVTFEQNLRDWEQGMMNELGENKIEVEHFKTEVGGCLESMSQAMNVKYALTTDYHKQVLDSMDQLEQQVYKPADTTRNFLPPVHPTGEKIISSLQEQVLQVEATQSKDKTTSTVRGEGECLETPARESQQASVTVRSAGQKGSQPRRRDSADLSSPNSGMSPTGALTPSTSAARSTSPATPPPVSTTRTLRRGTSLSTCNSRRLRGMLTA